MKEKISITEYANLITEALPKGILLNTNGDKFNSMVIGWGHIGTLWGLPTFVVYVRQSRYTKGQLDKTGEFTVSVPLDGIVPPINKERVRRLERLGLMKPVELKMGISSTTITHLLTTTMTCSLSRSGAMLMLWQLTGDSHISPGWAS